MLECNKCKSWTHYSCTALPLYQLYSLVTTSRRFTCEKCIDIPEDFINKFDSLTSRKKCVTQNVNIIEELSRFESSVVTAIKQANSEKRE